MTETIKKSEEGDEGSPMRLLIDATLVARWLTAFILFFAGTSFIAFIFISENRKILYQVWQLVFSLVWAVIGIYIAASGKTEPALDAENIQVRTRQVVGWLIVILCLILCIPVALANIEYPAPTVPAAVCFLFISAIFGVLSLLGKKRPTIPLMCFVASMVVLTLWVAVQLDTKGKVSNAAHQGAKDP